MINAYLILLVVIVIAPNQHGVFNSGELSGLGILLLPRGTG